MLLRLLEHHKILLKIKCGKDDDVYTKAYLSSILESKENTRKFLEGQNGGYYGWERDKKGRLVSVQHMFVSNSTEAKKLKELQGL